MPSSTYTTLLKTISSYVDKAKAEEVVGRQLPQCGQTADTLNPTGLKQIGTSIAGSIALYVADKAKREELVAAIRTLTG